MNRLKRFLTPPLIVLAASLMWCEEWLWERLKWLTRSIAQFPLIHWYEAAIVKLPPYPMLFVFLLPGLMLLPVKLLAVYWLTKGHWLTSIAVIAGAKVLGTAIAARSFVVCRPKLMTIEWFRFLHDWVIATRDFLYATIHAMPLYQSLRAHLTAFKQVVQRTFRRYRVRRGLWFRWRAIRRWHRLSKARRRSEQR